MLRPTALTLSSLVAACAGAPAAHPGRGPDAGGVARWNELVLEIAEEEDALLTLKGVRTAAMLHLAQHDALNAVHRRYAGYASADDAPGADPHAAAATAAYTVALDQYPDREEDLARELERQLQGAQRGTASERGKDLGRAAARAVLDRRAADRWDAAAEYVWHPMAPGVYAEFHEHSNTPQGFVFGAGWAEAEPFFLERSDQLRSPPPPPIESDAYTRAFREVEELGRYESASRTPDQTHLAMWWKDFVERSHNRLARRLVVEDDLDAWRSARLFALLNACIFDAYVSVFDNKFFHNHWRPYTAIRWAANDGNPDTTPDPGWTNTHRHTYAFPSYPSAHGCASAAAMEVLEETFGAERGFTMVTRAVDQAGPLSGKVEMDPPTRTFASFDDAARECALSRVYLGIHFRYDSLEGKALGERVARWGIERYLVPVPVRPR